MKSNLRLPIRDRRDLMIYSFPLDVADAHAAQVVRSLLASSPGGPPLRIVPITDRGAYDEALMATLAKAAREPGVVAAWLVNPERVAFGMRVRKPDGTDEEVVHAIRIIQILTN
jgi:citrate lyase beta subunit